MCSRVGVGNMPFSSAANGLVAGNDTSVVLLTFSFSTAPKKCVRFVTIGPPNDPPTRV